MAAVLEGLLAAIDIEIVAAHDVGAARYRCRDDGFGFAYVMIKAAAHRAGAQVLMAFDRTAAQMDGVHLVGS